MDNTHTSCYSTITIITVASLTDLSMEKKKKRKHKTHANRETDRWTVTKQGEREEERVAKETRGTTV